MITTDGLSICLNFAGNEFVMAHTNISFLVIFPSACAVAIMPPAALLEKKAVVNETPQRPGSRLNLSNGFVMKDMNPVQFRLSMTLAMNAPIATAKSIQADAWSTAVNVNSC
jgi:hypothetical protein